MHIFSIADSEANKNITRENTTIYIHPDSARSELNFSPADGMPEPLTRSLESTISAYRTRNYTATAVCARRTLEGIFKYLLPKDKQKATLAKLIDLAKSEVDLAAPLTKLSHAIRDGGNLGAHFDMEMEPDEAMARQLVELILYLTEYLYVLPEKIQNLEVSMASEGGSEDGV